MTRSKHQPAIKVLVVDDSAIVRKVLRQQLDLHPDIQVVATTPDSIVAWDKVLSLQPDVITLDLEMPRMDGMTFLRRLMRDHPLPTIILSALTPRGGQKAMEALAAGAVDVICKPGASASVADVCTELIRKIRDASRAHVKILRPEARCPVRRLASVHPANTVFAIGASTGGVQALSTVLSAFPANVPGTLVVQHMPKDFTSSFAARLNQECSVEVQEARDGDPVIPGRVLIAPGGYHMVLQRRGSHYCVAIQAGPRVYHQKPSVEVLFNSVAAQAGSHAVGAILTGMGQDGARGLLNMRQQGARTVAQDEETCVVYGMPKEAVKCGAAETVVPLHRVAETMLNMIRRPVAIAR